MTFTGITIFQYKFALKNACSLESLHRLQSRHLGCLVISGVHKQVGPLISKGCTTLVHVATYIFCYSLLAKQAAGTVTDNMKEFLLLGYN
jgi:hypothetical protein